MSALIHTIKNTGRISKQMQKQRILYGQGTEIVPVNQAI